jgi:hypothetical protein
MAVYGLWKPAFGEILPPEYFWRLVDAIDDLYNKIVRCCPYLSVKPMRVELQYTYGYYKNEFFALAEIPLETDIKPVIIDDMTYRKVIIRVPADLLSTVEVIIQDKERKLLSPGGRLEINKPIKPSEIKIKYRGPPGYKIYMLFER